MLKIPCEYRNNCGICGVNCQHCKVTTQYIPADKLISKFDGELPQNRTNSDVTCLLFGESIIPKIPYGLGNHFNNIRVLSLYNCQLQEICKEDLRGLIKLERLKLSNNILEHLPGDLFYFTKTLKYFFADNNKIKYIDPELFDRFEAFCEADLRNNVNINKHYKGFANIGAFREAFKMDCIQMKSTQYQKIVEENAKMSLKVQALEALTHKLEKDISDDINALMQKEDAKDFVIKIGESEFKVHKFLFMARSSTFAEMIKNNPDAENMELKDISEAAFKEILKFMYSDKEPAANANMEEIFGAASMLKVLKLKNATAKKIIETLTAKNAYERLVLGHKYDHNELKQKAFEEIKKVHPKLKVEMINEPQKLKVLIDAWRTFDYN